jgi:transposase
MEAPDCAWHRANDDPTRFKRFGKCIGLTSRRHASGEIDWSGRISNVETPCCYLERGLMDLEWRGP